MIESLLDLPSHLRERLAAALESGLLSEHSSSAAVRSVLGCAGPIDVVVDALRQLDRLGVGAGVGAAWIRSLGEAESRRPRVDLVWSGPEVPALHARDTRRVYREVVEAAQYSVWVSTYVFFDGPRAFETLAQRMDAVPGLRATLLLNLQRRRGDTSSADALVRRFADRFWTSEWPGTARPRIDYDPRSLEPDGPGGVLHAKAVVGDEETVFVTSANLTAAAFDCNIELGLVARDRTLAVTVTNHFQELIARGLLRPLPAA